MLKKATVQRLIQEFDLVLVSDEKKRDRFKQDITHARTLPELRRIWGDINAQVAKLHPDLARELVQVKDRMKESL